ncbi:hypothetical protein NDU88_001815 [Pleurodeles waltl]|uniref:Uncharacterized protein n=1 Tax=Pleurodeles waltl TaxID=8319 RepID=A0AAV7LZM8_PLEWA|nr:hypothetical protein NDU88_001815 [Pleurodeles waltl]
MLDLESHLLGWTSGVRQKNGAFVFGGERHRCLNQFVGRMSCQMTCQDGKQRELGRWCKVAQSIYDLGQNFGIVKPKELRGAILNKPVVAELKAGTGRVRDDSLNRVTDTAGADSDPARAPIQVGN